MSAELTAANRAQLCRDLSQYFSVEEIKILCSDLDIDGETIPGQDSGKAYWVGKLVRYCELAGRVPDLVQALKTSRPHLAWDGLLLGLHEIPAPPQGPLPALIEEIERQRRTVRIFNVTVPAVPVLLGLIGVVLLGAVGVWLAVTPTRMPEGPTKINVAVANFAMRAPDGSLQPSKDGEFLSRELFSGLQKELEPLGQKLGTEFQLTVWHDSMGLRKRTNIGTITDDTQAARLAKDINAHVVVYGLIDVTQGVTRVLPQFYVPATRGEADEIVGPYNFGRPIEANTRTQDDYWLQKNLKDRQKALSGFIVGLSYDLFGNTQAAQTAFEAVNADSALDWPPKEGKEILYYFIGRQLIQRQAILTDLAQRVDLVNQAESWFTQAISVNTGYARGYLGMGAVHYLRARFVPPSARLSDPDFQSEIQQGQLAYQRGLTEAQAVNMPAVESIALSGLGYITRLDAEAHLVQAAGGCSGAPKDAAQLALADQALAEAGKYLAQASAGLVANQQYREAARAYVAQGAVYEQLGCVRRLQNRAPEAKSLFDQAVTAYGACINQQTLSPNDRVIREDIVQKECTPFQQRAQKRRDDLV